MPTPFAALDALVSGAVDAALGERLRFTPQRKADNWNAGADGSRAIVECVGTFLDGDTDVSFTDGDRHQSSFNSRASNQTAFATVDRARFVPGSGPRKGDKVEVIDQIPVRAFIIIDVYPDGLTRWGFPLAPAEVS
jgi:hypothetical protein